MPFGGLFNKDIKNTTNIDQDITEYYTPVGIDGQGNKGLGMGAQDNSVGVGGPIADSFGDEAFAPQFNFNTQRGGAAGPAAAPSLTDYFNSEEAFQNEFNRIRSTGSQLTQEQWIAAHIAASPGDQKKYAAFGQPSALPEDSSVGLENFGGAVQGAGFNVAGPISAPIASGEDSFAAQLGSGVIAQGPVNLDGGNLISGNQGTINIINPDADIARAAITGAKDQLSDSLVFANRALAAVGESRRDPGEKVTSQAINTVTIAAVAFAALVLFSR